MGGWRLQLLGGFRLLDPAGEQVSISAQKSKALLAYLAVNGDRPQSRAKLATLLWEDSDEARARASLRQALAALRRALPEALLLADGEELQLQIDGIAVDARDFAAAAASGDNDGDEHAIGLYRGDLLEGFGARAPSFEDWMLAERQRLRERALEVMERRLARLTADHAIDAAIGLALRILALDPLREATHRTLMELYARQGRQAEALRQYRSCRRLLQKELGVFPDAQTEALYREIVAQRAGDEPPAVEPGTTPLPPPSAPSPDDDGAPTTPTPASEPRPTTILFANLSPRTAQVGDPEQLQELLAAAAEVVAEVVTRYGGQLVQGGDAVIAAFGLPQVHTNDAERALRAAQELHRLLAAQGLVQAQIGIASGRVIAAGPDGARPALVGGALSLARKLAGRADLGETFLAPGVHAALGQRVIAEPVEGAESGWRLSAIAADLRPDGPLVGRGTQLRQLIGALEACLEEGAGHTLLLRGEAGIGKTRLCLELAEIAAQRGFRCHRALVLDFGVPRGEGVAATLARGLLDLPTASEALAAAAVDRAIAEGTVSAERAVYVNPLLGLPQRPDLRAIDDALDAEAHRRGRCQLLAELLLATSRRAPRLVLVEDVHWADAATVELLGALARATAECRALLVLTSRSEDEPSDPHWRRAIGDAALMRIELGPLRPQEARQLASARARVDHQPAADEPASNDWIEQCIARAGGNPLFLEQLLRAPTAADNLPDSVQSIVMARVDRLAPSDRRAAQAASVLGQRFSLSALIALLDQPDYRCDALLEHGLVRVDGDGYLFAHALVAEGVYRSLPRDRRRELHRRVAAWIGDRDLALRAEHLDRGEDPAAGQAYLEAAQAQLAEHQIEAALTATGRGLQLASDDALRFELRRLQGDLLLQRGEGEAALAAVQAALDLASNDRQRFVAHLTHADVLRHVDRHQQALEALEAAERSLAASGANDDVAAQLHYLRGNLYFPLGDYQRCEAEHQRALKLARRAASPRKEAQALSGLGDANFSRGLMSTAHDHFDRCLRLAQEHGFGRIEVANLPMRALTTAYQLRFDDALADVERAAALAARIEDRRAEMAAHGSFGEVMVYTPGWSAAQGHVERALALARRLGAPRFEATYACLLGSLLARRGDRGGGRRLIERAYQLSCESGPKFCGPWTLGGLALAAEDPQQRRWALAEGERLLAEGCVGYNYLDFYRDAIDASRGLGDWDEVERYAAALEAFTAAEPLPLWTFFVGRGRALAAFARDPEAAPTLEQLDRLHRRATAAGLLLGRTAIARALGRPCEEDGR